MYKWKNYNVKFGNVMYVITGGYQEIYLNLYAVPSVRVHIGIDQKRNDT
jgi:hypothetical protein